jgi:hypothetical protein
MNMRQLVQKIVAGQTSFDPFGSSDLELRAFQLVAA